MQPLPTLGGDHGFATAVTDRGQIVGWAETTVVTRFYILGLFCALIALSTLKVR